MIKTMLIGNLGADARHQVIQNGKNVINFDVAVSKKYRDQQGNIKDKTTWVNVSYWTDKLAVLPYLTKGATVYVEGEIEARAYTGTDNKVYGALQLATFQVKLVGGRKAEQQPQAGATPQQAPTPAPADITEPLDDLQF